jgi:hypothetical protein
LNLKLREVKFNICSKEKFHMMRLRAYLIRISTIPRWRISVRRSGYSRES